MTLYQLTPHIGEDIRLSFSSPAHVKLGAARLNAARLNAARLASFKLDDNRGFELLRNGNGNFNVRVNISGDRQ